MKLRVVSIKQNEIFYLKQVKVRHDIRAQLAKMKPLFFIRRVSDCVYVTSIVSALRGTK